LERAVKEEEKVQVELEEICKSNDTDNLSIY